MKLFSALTLVAACVLSSQAYTQTTFLSIQGNVYDAETSDALPYASVYIKGKPIGTTTNPEGRFIFHIPSQYAADTLVISVIGYQNFTQAIGKLLGKENAIPLQPSTQVLQEVVVTASRKKLSAKEIVRKAVASIPANYPTQPFVLEAFFKDLQIENGKPVELLEASTRFFYKDYNPGQEQVEIIEVRRSLNKRHPVNGTYDRQNSIFDLMEDNFIKERFGPIGMKGWTFAIDTTLIYNNKPVYKIAGRESASEQAILYIDKQSFAIVKMELTRKMIDGEYYRRYLNLPDPYGMQETSYKMVFEYREFEGKLYLSYQREEDTYNLFNKTTNEILIRQSFMKELFVNNLITRPGEMPKASQTMNINKSVEQQAKPYNEDFWKYYNSPALTSQDSKIVAELQELETKK